MFKLVIENMSASKSVESKDNVLFFIIIQRILFIANMPLRTKQSFRHTITSLRVFVRKCVEEKACTLTRQAMDSPP